MSFFPIFYAFFLFCALARTLWIMLNSCGYQGHPCRVNDLQGKVFNILSFSMFAVGLLEIEGVLFYSCFAKRVYHERKFNIIKWIFYISWNDHFVNVMNDTVLFSNFNQTLHSWVKPHLAIMYYVLWTFLYVFWWIVHTFPLAIYIRMELLGHRV